MAEQESNSIVQNPLKEYLQKENRDRVVVCPVDHPSRTNPYCRCHGPLLPRLWYFFKAAVLEATLRQPFNAPKIWLLRWYGAKIGNNVYISIRAWIDPSHLELLTIEDDVLIGMEARILMHEYRLKEFRAGTVHLGKGSLIGAFAIIGPGVRVGEEALVGAGAVVGRDVPKGATVGGNPARKLSTG